MGLVFGQQVTFVAVTKYHAVGPDFAEPVDICAALTAVPFCREQPWQRHYRLLWSRWQNQIFKKFSEFRNQYCWGLSQNPGTDPQ